MKRLIERLGAGVITNARDSAGRTPLDFAASELHGFFKEDIVRLLKQLKKHKGNQRVVCTPGHAGPRISGPRFCGFRGPVFVPPA